jgi:hypothetical protein
MASTDLVRLFTSVNKQVVLLGPKVQASGLELPDVRLLAVEQNIGISVIQDGLFAYFANVRVCEKKCWAARRWVKEEGLPLK